MKAMLIFTSNEERQKHETKNGINEVDRVFNRMVNWVWRKTI